MLYNAFNIWTEVAFLYFIHVYSTAGMVEEFSLSELYFKRPTHILAIRSKQMMLTPRKILQSNMPSYFLGKDSGIYICVGDSSTFVTSTNMIS